MRWIKTVKLKCSKNHWEYENKQYTNEKSVESSAHTVKYDLILDAFLETVLITLNYYKHISSKTVKFSKIQINQSHITMSQIWTWPFFQHDRCLLLCWARLFDQEIWRRLFLHSWHIRSICGLCSIMGRMSCGQTLHNYYCGFDLFQLCLQAFFSWMRPTRWSHQSLGSLVHL